MKTLKVLLALSLTLSTVAALPLGSAFAQIFLVLPEDRRIELRKDNQDLFYKQLVDQYFDAKTARLCWQNEFTRGATGIELLDGLFSRYFATELHARYTFGKKWVADSFFYYDVEQDDGTIRRLLINSCPESY